MNSMRRLAAGAMLTALAASAHATDSPAPTVVHVYVAGEVNVEFELDGIDAVGFTHRQRTTKEDEAVQRAMENLRAASDWIRFNAEAHCHESATSIGANIYRTIDPDAPKHPALTRPAIEAHFTFACDAMPSLRTLDLGLIERFPRVREVIVDVHTPASHYADVVTTPAGAVALTPK